MGLAAGIGAAQAQGDRPAAPLSASAPTQVPREAPVADCRPDPLAGRPLYLRGSFNGWTADDSHRLRWSCRHWEGVAALTGEHRFKVGDEAWSADADFGRPPASATATEAGPNSAAPLALALRGGDVQHRFSGLHRIQLQPATAGQPPQLRIEACPAPPQGPRTLYLRGSLNNWAAQDAYAFTWHCDAYLLNVQVQGRHVFKVADADWTPATITPANGGMHTEVFTGAHTLRLSFDTQGRPQLVTGPLTFVDPRPPRITDPAALSLRFDSRSPDHKRPFGAVPAGTPVQWAVQSAAGVDALTLVLEQRQLEGNQERLAYTPLVRLAMQGEAAAAGSPDASPVRWVAQYTPASVAVHGYWFEARIGGQTYVLHNNDQPVAWTREKGAGGLATVARAPEASATPPITAVRRFRLSVYRPDFRPPDWAADAVYYQVFPDRFRNGDKSNDPKPGTRRYQQHGIELHPRWLESPYKPGSGDGSDAAFNNDFFGGDLAGLIDKLPHLQRLGINAVYMTPVFLAASNHKYDTADYHRIDPAFGTNADFERLTREAQRLGIRIVPDASLNHTGSDSVYFDRYGNHAGPDGRSRGAFAFGKINPDSPYAGWYRFDARQTDPGKQYQGWTGVADLPELDKQSPAWRDFAYRAPDSVTRRWLQAGAAGWRMDVAPWVPDDFWREWRGVVKATKPDAVTIAETWFDPAKHLLGDMFDASMNYIFRNAVLDWANGGPATALAAQLEHLREQLPAPAHAVMMNLLSSHDVPRALHVLGDTGPGAGPAAQALARQRLRLAVALQMAYPGAPTVYYGDEVGLAGGDDPYNRAPYPWEDEGGQPDRALEADFRTLIGLRQAHPVLRRGQLLPPLHADDAVLVLARRLPPAQTPAGPASRWLVSAFNQAPEPREVLVPLPADAPPGPYRLVLDLRPDQAAATPTAVPALAASAGPPQRLRLRLPAGSAWWLLAD